MDDAQNLVPVRLVDGDDNGTVVLRVIRARGFTALLFRLFRQDLHMRVTLDPIGSEVWRHCDGRTAGAILVALEKAFPEEHQLGERLGAFLSQMVKVGALRLDAVRLP